MSCMMVMMLELRDVSENDPVKMIVEVQISPGRQNPAGIIAVQKRVPVVRPCTGPPAQSTRAWK